MREVSKTEFREAYFTYGRCEGGWTQAYWIQFYEPDRDPPMKYRLEPPSSPLHTRMMIVDDFAVHEHRLFFLTEESEESFFRS